MAHPFGNPHFQRGGNGGGPSRPVNPLDEYANPQEFQVPATYDSSRMVPCTNEDLTESPGVDPTKAPIACVDLPQENNGQGVPPPIQAAGPSHQHALPPGFVPYNPQAGPSSAPSVGMMPIGWGAQAAPTQVSMRGFNPHELMFPGHVNLQDHWSYDPNRMMPCNNIDVKVSPPAMLGCIFTELAEFEDTPGASTSAAAMTQSQAPVWLGYNAVAGEAPGRVTTGGGSRVPNKRKQVAPSAYTWDGGRSRSKAKEVGVIQKCTPIQPIETKVSHPSALFVDLNQCTIFL